MHNPFEPYELQFSQEERKKLIAKTIKELRTAKNLQQKELCEIMQIPQTTYNGYEKGRSEPPIEFLVRLSFFYGVDMNFITQRNFFNKTEADAFKNIAEQKIEIAKLKERLSQDNSRRILESFLLYHDPIGIIKKSLYLDGPRACYAE